VTQVGQDSPSPWFIALIVIGWFVVMASFYVFRWWHRKEKMRFHLEALNAKSVPTTIAPSNNQVDDVANVTPAEVVTLEAADSKLTRGFMMTSLGFRGARTADGGLALFQVGQCEHCREAICMGIRLVAPPVDELQWSSLLLVDMPARRGGRSHTAAPILCETCAESWLKPNTSFERTREG